MNDQPGPWGAAPPPPPPRAPDGWPPNVPGADGSLEEGEAARIAFADRRRDFFRLCLRGAALQFVTFGFYRFWLTTDVRRHLWSHTSLDGDALEYTGRAQELLIGFLVALAILTPVYAVYFLIGVEAERLRAFASVPLFFFLYLFGHFALYRARRYRLSRTVWRGVRFWMDGSGWAYAGRVFLWSLAVGLTAGAAWPWRVASLERYKMRHSLYGDQRGDFVGGGWALFKRVWWIGLILVFAVAAFAIGTVESIQSAMLPGRRAAFGGVGMTLAGLALFALPFVIPVYRAIEWRWWADGARLGETRLTCRLSYGALLGLYVKSALVGGLVVFGLVAAMMAVGAGMVAGLAGALKGSSLENVLSGGAGGAAAYAAIALMVAAYLVVGLAVGVVQRVYLQHDYWSRIATSLTVVGLDGLAAVTQRGDAANALGEGLADGLDVGGL
ncbi:MAG: DUF898 family protein [Rhizobiales bacterium]|nr:DUF898 family protein [Hyphomicrobiales bacterium]